MQRKRENTAKNVNKYQHKNVTVKMKFFFFAIAEKNTKIHITKTKRTADSSKRIIIRLKMETLLCNKQFLINNLFNLAKEECNYHGIFERITWLGCYVVCFWTSKCRETRVEVVSSSQDAQLFANSQIHSSSMPFNKISFASVLQANIYHSR